MSALRQLAILGLLMLVSPVVAAPGAEWPGFRGPEGRGVADEPGPLPEVWEPGSPRIRWRTALPGEGVSSPVASGGRVFVTAAREGSRNELLQKRLAGLSLALALVTLLVVLRGAVHSAPEGGLSRGARWDRRVVLAASLLSLFLALVLSIQPALFVVVGNPGRAWRTVGAIALLALAAAFGWSRRGSWWRPLGAVTVVVAASLLVRYGPTGALGRAPASKLLPALAPGLASALWYVVSFWWSRRKRDPGPTVSARGRWIAVSLISIALLAFVPHNFLTGLQRLVVCLDLDSGEILWERIVLTGPAEQKSVNNSYATPTPVTDGERVFAYFGHGLAGLDLEGRVEWRVAFPGYADSTRYGAGPSPIANDEAVIVVREEEVHQEGPPSWIAAFDKESGDVLWRIEPPEARDSYTTPMLVATPTGQMLLTMSWESLVAYDAATGERLWSREHAMQQVVPSMARAGDLVAITGGIHGEKTLMVLRLGAEGAAAGAEVVWQTNRGVADVSSPVIYGGRLFTVTRSGIMHAYDVETGAVVWKKRLGGDYYASLIAGDGKVYATNTEGSTSVVATDPEPRLVAVNEFEELTYATPAIADGCLLLRTSKHLYCIEAVK